MKVYTISEIVHGAEELQKYYESDREFVSFGDYKYLQQKYEEVCAELDRMNAIYDHQNQVCSVLFAKKT